MRTGHAPWKETVTTVDKMKELKKCGLAKSTSLYKYKVREEVLCNYYQRSGATRRGDETPQHSSAYEHTPNGT